MGIPRHTRIILIPDDEGGTREYGISRSAVFTLAGLALVLLLVVLGLMVSFAGMQDERARVRRLEEELSEAAATRRLAAELQVELESSREVQERLLMMLGVSKLRPGQGDTFAAGPAGDPGPSSEALRQAAAVALSPAPELWPAGGYVTREFAVGQAARGTRPHLGIDIAGPLDAPILAASSGRVARTGTDEFLGNFVEIEHGLGYLTVYGHCSRIAVRQGDAVSGGQVIAYMGKTGQATATHLHFEIWRQGEAIDPREILAGDPPRN